MYVQQIFAHGDASQPAITTEPCTQPTYLTQTSTSIIHEATTLPHDESRAQKIDTALIDIKAHMATAPETPETRTTEGMSLELPNTILTMIGISPEERSQVQALRS